MCSPLGKNYTVNTVSHVYAFLCLYFDSMLILCNIYVEFEHFILFNKFDKYHNFIYNRINIGSSFQDVVMLQVQSDLGYPATSGPAHIRISDLAGYGRYA